MDHLSKELLSLHNIVKDGDGYKLQNNYYKDGDRIIPVVPFEHRDHHNCGICSHFRSMGAYGCCDIYDKLLNLPEQHVVWCSSVVNCAAYNQVNQMNIIKSLDEMIEFVAITENFFDTQENYEEYYGFHRNWNENTGEILETVKEYYNRGGTFTNAPTKYPCVIRFDWNCEDDLEWIYIGNNI